MATKMQVTVVAILISLCLIKTGAALAYSDVHLSNGLGFKYNYGIQHAYHGHHHGSSYPHAYGGYGSPGYHIGSGYYDHV